MSAESVLSSSDAEARPTQVRHWVIAVATLMSVLLYLDRFAVGIASEYIREDLRMTQTQMSWFLSAFFWSYALAQVPAGWFSDRFGSRRMLTVYILAWSAFTGLLGIAYSVWLVLLLRLLIGVSQAGAYPTSGGLIRHWFPIRSRGTASSLVGLGGRFGAVLAPILTAWLIVAWSHGREVPDFDRDDVISASDFFSRLHDARDSEKPPDILSRQFYDRFSAETRKSAAYFLSREKVAEPLNSRTWLDAVYDLIPRETSLDGWDWNWISCHDDTIRNLNECLDDPKFVTRDNTAGLALPREAARLLKKRDAGSSLTKNETRLLNRLALERAMPKSLRKFYGPGWRPTLIAYGIVGLVVAIAFAWVGRDTPKQHPWCNEAERNIIHDEATLAVMRTEPRDPEFPWQAMLTNVSLWGNSLMQFTTNVGWLFVVTWLPRYLDKVHGVSLVQQGIMTAVPSGVGILTLFVGGRWTDIAARRFGLKWGRRLPILLTRFSAAAGYGMCLLLSLMFDPNESRNLAFNWLPWGYVLGLSFAAASVDLGTPAVWAFAQDVGGKYTGSILGWANMWGNLGAAAAPLIYNAVLGEKPTIAQWNEMFGVCALAFVISGLCALVIDSTRPLVREAAS